MRKSNKLNCTILSMALGGSTFVFFFFFFEVSLLRGYSFISCLMGRRSYTTISSINSSLFLINRLAVWTLQSAALFFFQILNFHVFFFFFKFHNGESPCHSRELQIAFSIFEKAYPQIYLLFFTYTKLYDFFFVYFFFFFIFRLKGFSL